MCNVTSQGVQVMTGLRQGNTLSPLLFNLVLEKFIWENNTEEYGIVLNNKILGVLNWLIQCSSVVKEEQEKSCGIDGKNMGYSKMRETINKCR